MIFSTWCGLIQTQKNVRDKYCSADTDVLIVWVVFSNGYTFEDVVVWSYASKTEF